MKRIFKTRRFGMGCPAIWTWNQGSAYPRSVRYLNNLWILTCGPAASPNNLYTATDPTGPWTNQNTPLILDFPELHGSAYGAGKWVVVGLIWGQPALPKILTSTDGVTWTERYCSGGELFAIDRSDNLFVAVGLLDPTVISSDGITWTTNSCGMSGLRTIIYANGLWVAAGSFGVLGTSLDGITWTIRSSGVSSSINALTYGDSKYVGCTYDSKIITSPDGITWTVQTLFPSGFRLNDIAYGNGCFVCAARLASTEIVRGYLFTSPDAITWTQLPAIYNHAMNVAGYGNGHWVVDNTEIYTATV